MIRNFNSLIGYSLAASDGEIGTIREMYFNDKEWALRYLVVTTGLWLTGRDVLIAPHALGELDAQRNALAVHLTKEQVRDAPPVTSEQPVSRQYEERYYRHYGWEPYWGATAAGQGMMPIPAAPPPPDQAATPSSGEETSTEESVHDPHLRSSSDVRSYAIHAQDGVLGHVSDYLIDDADWNIRYIVIATHTWLPGKHVLLGTSCVELISFRDGEVFVNLPRSTIEAAPPFDPESEFSRAFEQRLHDHYRHRAYWDAVNDARSEAGFRDP